MTDHPTDPTPKNIQELGDRIEEALRSWTMNGEPVIAKSSHPHFIAQTIAYASREFWKSESAERTEILVDVERLDEALVMALEAAERAETQRDLYRAVVGLAQHESSSLVTDRPTDQRSETPPELLQDLDSVRRHIEHYRTALERIAHPEGPDDLDQVQTIAAAALREEP